ncbi:PilZ domain-containing protein [Breoghania sp.]|uniref:PilZ domain-containing protein n=1 Tax=Breoghania sp. TaxID=2065378 RepID=UPI0026194F0F|nr:PilZ domain-containing protein [Breoghania sp.]MDJ0931785.1 PilZ domain-containing protein [Breoghania sp.]
MSFILPALNPKNQEGYVRRLLMGVRDDTPPVPEDAVTPQEAEVWRQAFQKVAEIKSVTTTDFVGIKEEVWKEVGSAQQASPDFVFEADFTGSGEAGDAPAPNVKFERWLKDEMTIRAAASEEAEAEPSHRLLPLADHLPANPRQIKRIVNAVTMYNAVAIQQRDWESDNPRWLQLARWIVIMTEWPKSWRALASYPAFADPVPIADEKELEQKAGAALKNLESLADLPASLEQIQAEVARIRNDANLLTLVSGDVEGSGEALDRAAVLDLSTLTPLHSRITESGGTGTTAKRKTPELFPQDQPLPQDQPRASPVRYRLGMIESRIAPPHPPASSRPRGSRNAGEGASNGKVIDLVATRVVRREGNGGMGRKPEPGRDARRHPRKPTRLRMGKIADLDDRFVSECVIRDLSPGGARLVLSAKISLPAIIVLFDELEDTIVPTTVRWRCGNETGINFDVPPAKLKHFRLSRLRSLAHRYYVVDD